MNALADRIAQSETPGRLIEILAAIGFDQLDMREVRAIYRRLHGFDFKPDLRIAYLGNHTIEPLPSYVQTSLACEGILAGSYVGSYNQYFQDVLNEASPLHAYDPNLIFLTLTLRELSPKFFQNFAALAAAEIEAELEQLLQQMNDWASAAKERTSATLLICNFVGPLQRQLGIADVNQPFGETQFYARLNEGLLNLFKDDTRVHVFDMDHVTSNFGRARAFDARMYYLARLVWQESFLPELAKEMARYAIPLMGRTRKCLVVDLDNTLWGGVVGEEGPEGIKIDQGDPVGEAYRAFQSAVRSFKERGILLAIASKNNEDDALEVFDIQQDMPLSLDDFSAREINWQSKHESLVRIAETLNIGTDALVFVDDNPAECALIGEMLPEVKVVHLDGDPSEFSSLLRARTEFEKFSITSDDRAKVQQYAENEKRVRLKDQTGNLENYLRNLETKVIIRRPTDKDSKRIHQLFTKTNQFNVTTKRYGAADVDRFLGNNQYDIKIVNASDRFGDLGTIGLVLLDRKGEMPEIDSFILSCRAMGRQIETAIMNKLKESYLISREHQGLQATFIPTKKNKPVASFYEEQGFDVVEHKETGEKLYRLTMDDANVIDISFIDVASEM